MYLLTLKNIIDPSFFTDGENIGDAVWSDQHIFWEAGYEMQWQPTLTEFLDYFLPNLSRLFNSKNKWRITNSEALFNISMVNRWSDGKLNLEDKFYIALDPYYAEDDWMCGILLINPITGELIDLGSDFWRGSRQDTSVRKEILESNPKIGVRLIRYVNEDNDFFSDLPYQTFKNAESIFNEKIEPFWFDDEALLYVPEYPFDGMFEIADHKWNCECVRFMDDKFLEKVWDWSSIERNDWALKSLWPGIIESKEWGIVPRFYHPVYEEAEYDYSLDKVKKKGNIKTIPWGYLTNELIFRGVKSVEDVIRFQKTEWLT